MPESWNWYVLDLSAGRILQTWFGCPSRIEPPAEALELQRQQRNRALAVGPVVPVDRSATP